MAEARIDVVIGSAQAQSGARAVQRAVDSIKSGFVDMAAKVFVAEQAIERTWRLATRGAAFEETMGRLNRQMGQFHGSAQLMVNDLQAISNQTLSIDKAASMASRALAIGLNPDQIRTFTQAADLLDDVMGTDLPTAFDNIVQAAITGRSQILANIGVYVDLDEEVKRLAVSTGRTAEQITRQEKAMIAAKAIASQAGDAMKRLSDGTVSDADKLKQYEKSWDDLTLAISRFAKTAVVEGVEALKALTELMTPEEHSLTTTMLAITGRNPAVEQNVFGRAIVADALGKLGRQPTVRSEPAKGLPTALQGKQLESERERQDKALQGDLERTKIALDSLGRLYDLDAQRQLITQEDLVKMKGDLRLRDLEAQGETLNRQLELETVFHERRRRIGFESTEERIEEEERFRSKVFDINESVRKIESEHAAASQQVDAERAIARAQAEQALGQRLTDDAQKQFEIREAMRQREFDGLQTYYQGEIDMANARFAGDEEIAQKERELLRAQMAFKLRLTQEEADRLIFLRKSPGNFDAVQAILDRADPTLTPRAREGIMESTVAKDIELQERATGDFFAGWSRGLQKYTRDTESSFGMAQDMARRTAQAMEQGFQRFFFDGMDGKFRGFKDVLAGVLDFTKQIVSQIAAQMMTVGIIKPGASALAGLFGGGSKTPDAGAPLYSAGERFGGIERFAMGGISSRPRTMALAGRTVEFGEGPQAEAFVPLPDGRTIPVTMKFAGALPAAAPMGGPPIAITMPVTVVNQVEGAQVQTQQTTGPNGMPQLEVLITKSVNKAVAEGRFDKTMRTRFGLTPGER